MAKTTAFEATFKTLRRLLKPYEKQFDVVVDKPGRYYLASKTAKTSSGAAIWFGGVDIKKNYVTFHLIPVYATPQLLDDASPALRKRMHGKGCFNFTVVEPEHVKALTAITKKGATDFAKKFE